VDLVVEQNAEECGRLEMANGDLQRLSASLGAAVGAFRANS
jgi:methyl-accepting chemotaxis protein